MRILRQRFDAPFLAALILLLSGSGVSSAALLPDSGQTLCYDGAGAVITCPSSGTLAQDGSYPVNPLSYTNNNDGTIRDNNTGLVWQQGTSGTTKTWYDSSAYCSSLSLGGLSGWRVPAKRELAGLVNYGAASAPYINTAMFGTTSGNFWAITANAQAGTYAWYVSFANGTVSTSPKTNLYYIRCVNGPQLPAADFVDNADGTVTDNTTGLIWQKTASTSTYAWDAALSYCEGLTLGGDSRWRVPNVKALESISDATRYGAAANTTFFADMASQNYWSSTSGTPKSAGTSVGFSLGSIAINTVKSAKQPVRCVIKKDKSDLAISMAGSTSSIEVGGTITYLIAVTNNGLGPATGVAVTDTLPALLTIQSFSTTKGTCSSSGNTVTCSLGQIAKNAGATVTINATAPLTPGTVTNNASVSCTSGDPSSANNTAQTITAVNNLVRTLNVSVVGSGSVAATGINCPGDCTEPYDDGTTVSLDASPLAGWMFGGWLGDLTGAMNPADLLMNANKSVTANFIADTDEDGIPDSTDNCPTVANADQTDTDHDGLGDACDPCVLDPLNDVDVDGVCGNVDNCPAAANPDQADSDLDGFGDVCDACPLDPLNDVDVDGVCGNVDNCPAAANPDQADSDLDGFGDVCDACPLDPLNDVDVDGVCGNVDNCPAAANPDQADSDQDGFGDVCDACPLDAFNDIDGDGACANVDNCPNVWNQDQADNNHDGKGDSCALDADLVPILISGPATANAGDEIPVSVWIKNNGSYQALRGFEAAIYLSIDNVIGSEDVIVGKARFRRMPSGKTGVWHGAVKIPAMMVGGVYYIGVDANSDNAVIESNKVNNRLAGNQIAVAAVVPYVNTISVKRAKYNRATQELDLQAESGYGASAALEATGYGAMKWDAVKHYWHVRLNNVPEASLPVSITVQGAEGAAVVPILRFN